MTMITGSVLSIRSKNAELVYVFFLAIKATERSKGYGNGLMKLIKERYQGKVIGLSAERPECEAGLTTTSVYAV